MVWARSFDEGHVPGPGGRIDHSDRGASAASSGIADAAAVQDGGAPSPGGVAMTVVEVVGAREVVGTPPRGVPPLEHPVSNAAVSSPTKDGA